METNQKASVVIVDDEEMVITSIKAFLQLETEFDVRGFTDPEEAVRFIEKAPIEIAVSDYLMPRMNGIQFLAKARQLQPEASRVLLTGHADKQSAITAINQVALFQYIEKPWDNAQLLLVIRSGIERTQLFRQLREVQRSLIKAFL